MKILFGLLIFAFVAFVYMLLRFFIKRVSLRKALKKFAKQHNYTYKISFRNLLPGNNTNRLVEVETANTIYRIKLFGLLRKHCEIHFWDSRNYSTAWHFNRYSLVGSAPIGVSGTCRRKNLGADTWTETESKNVVPVLLIDPPNAPVRLTQTHVNHLVDLRAGEKIENVLFADRDFLFRFIEKQEKV